MRSLSSTTFETFSGLTNIKNCILAAAKHSYDYEF